jgi:hypothetical protein
MILRLLTLFICFFWITGFQMVTGPPPTVATNLIFYSDFEDANDDAQWGSLPSGWNDDYTTSPLEGNESLYNAASETTHSSDTFTTTSGTVYGRLAFRGIDFTSQVDQRNGLDLRLQLDGDTKAGCWLYWYLTDFSLLYAYDGVNNTTASLTGVDTFSDGKYWLYITYIPGTSVQCQIKNDSGDVVSSADATRTTSESSGINQIMIAPRASIIRYKLDQVEIRKNTSWGSE